MAGDVYAPRRSRTVTRRECLNIAMRGAALLSLLGGGTGCGLWPASPANGRTATFPPRDRAASVAPTPTAAPRRGGRATIGVVSDLRQLNPAFGGPDLPNALFRATVESLFDFDGEGQPRPWLAEEVPRRGRGISTDGMTVIVRLRQGVAWEDGEPFTAADVLFTLAVGRNPANPFAPEIADAYRAIRAAEALDPYTVRLTLTAPGDAYLRAFSPVLPAHLFNGVTDLIDQPYVRAPFGTGPFRFAEWTPGVALTLARSPSYRLGDRPYLDRITFRTYQGTTTADTALRAGMIDLLLGADGQTLTAPQDGPVQGIAPARNAPPTWNAGDWYRARD